jgi:3'-5' exoribonuclease
MDTNTNNKGLFVADFLAGERVTGFFLVRQKKLEPFRDRAKGEFLSLVLGDRTGQVTARVWDGASALSETFAQGDYVKVAGDVEEYQGRTQLIVQRLRVAQPNEIDLADFVTATQRDIGTMLAQVRAEVDNLRDPNLAALVRYFYDDPEFVTAFQQAPASRRLHHAYLGGWLEHLSQVLTLCDAVLTLHPEISAELLRAGVLLLSAGKMRELAWDRDIDLTDAGRLLGQAVLGDEAVGGALAHLPDFPPELALRVRHMLASHRGRYEWGAARPPMTLEAIALHHIENLNTQVSRFRDLLAARREQNQPWTNFDRLLGRQLYAGGEDVPGRMDGPEE